MDHETLLRELQAMQALAAEEKAKRIAAEAAAFEAKACWMGRNYFNKAEASEERVKRLAAEEDAVAFEREIKRLKHEKYVNTLTKLVHFKSAASVWDEFLALAKRLEYKHVQHPVPDHLISRAWADVKAKKNASDTHLFPDELNVSIEDAELHPLVEELCKTIQNSLGVTGYSVMIRHVMTNPALKPDLIIVPSIFSRPGWLDIRRVIEVKLPSDPNQSRSPNFKAGVLQALQYCFYSGGTDSTINDDVLALFIDYKEIAVMKIHIDTDSVVVNWSKVTPLFPKGWHSHPTPTNGFIWLCRSLFLPPPPPPNTLMVNDMACIIHGTLSYDPLFTVSCIEFEQKLYAMKWVTQKSKSGSERLRGELGWVTNMLDIGDLNFAITQPFLPLTDVSRGFLCLELGIPLHDWVVDHKDAPDFPTRFATSMHDIFRALFVLHCHDFYHGDIRPNNIIIVNDKPKLIDWLTAGKVGSIYSFRQGAEDPYLADELMGVDKMTGLFFQYRPIWDMYSLAYTILGLNEAIWEFPAVTGESSFIARRALWVKQKRACQGLHQSSELGLNLLSELEKVLGPKLNKDQFDAISSIFAVE